MKNKRISILLATALFSTVGCSNLFNLPQTSLSGAWKIESIQQEAVLAHSIVNIKFDKQGIVSGAASCNNFSGQYTVENNVLNIGVLAVTRKMCPTVLMQQEQKVLESLQHIKTFQEADNKLILIDEQNNIQLRARAL